MLEKELFFYFHSDDAQINFFENGERPDWFSIDDEGHLDYKKIAEHYGISLEYLAESDYGYLEIYNSVPEFNVSPSMHNEEGLKKLSLIEKLLNYKYENINAYIDNTLISYLDIFE